MKVDYGEMLDLAKVNAMHLVATLQQSTRAIISAFILNIRLRTVAKRGSEDSYTYPHTSCHFPVCQHQTVLTNAHKARHRVL